MARKSDLAWATAMHFLFLSRESTIYIYAKQCKREILDLVNTI